MCPVYWTGGTFIAFGALEAFASSWRPNAGKARINSEKFCQYLIFRHASSESSNEARRFLGGKVQSLKTVYEGAAHSMRKACTGSMEAARRAGMMLAMAAASTSTPMATIMTGTFTLVVS